MATVTCYPQPAAANYHTAPLTSRRQRTYRICDTCGAHETSAVKFRLCGGCMTTQYCSQDCQRAHWPSHKVLCQHTVTQVKQVSHGYCHDENVVKMLRKFTSSYESLLGWAGFQALKVKRVPSNIRQKVLLVDINLHNNADSRRRYSIASTHVVDKSYIRDSLVLAEIQRRDERSRQNGGIGTLIVLIQCGGATEVMPVEVDAPSKITWDSRDDWAQVLAHFVENGRTDFKPISTTPKGVYYG
ncbi:hypothetical protein CPC08DRAFT_723984 [Agrocybe pediades]|nr:hypothetical protein CPC08DRAFT_723984 [Agrocybe pediades]